MASIEAQSSRGYISLSVVGINHATAPIEIRERLSLTDERLEAALGALREMCGECAILSTCNRLEIYAMLPASASEQRVLESVYGLEAEEMLPYTYLHRGEAAVRHLFRVASGADSLVIGEVQILGQVHRAWQAAHTARAAGPVISQLFHKAVALGKRVHSETGISRKPASVSYAAVVLARQIFGDELAQRRVLVIGTGEVGEGVARCLYAYGLHATVVAHRQLERAHAMAQRYKADVASWDELHKQMAGADIVISSTSAPHTILQHAHVARAMQDRTHPLYLIDLAVPRDIDPSAAQLPGVHLHNIDDLQAVVRSTMEERQLALPQVEAMLDAETARFSGWLISRSTAPVIRKMQAHAEEVTRLELQWAMSKLPGLSPRERQVVEMMAARIAGKLLHEPIQRLKADAAAAEPDYTIEAVSPIKLQELFYRGDAIGPQIPGDTLP